MSLSNHSDTVQYDRARGVLLLFDSSGSTQTVYADVAAVVDAVAAGVVDDACLPSVAGYALVLAVREHTGWPTESRRAGLIQVAQHLRSAWPTSVALDQILDDVITHANGALMRGEADVERILADFVAAHI